jgi:cytochrome b561
LPRGPAHSEWFLWHKTLGATILALALIRLGWRLTHQPPPFPPGLSGWERSAAVWSHRLFYFLIIVIPLTGLAAVSGNATGATTPLIGGLPLPVIPGVSKGVGEAMGAAHVWLVLATILLLVIHIAAALKQQFVDRARVAGRMPPFRAPGGEKATPAN